MKQSTHAGKCAESLQDATVDQILIVDNDPVFTEQKGFDRSLLKAYENLETRVAERTAELAKANDALHAELQERRKIEEMLQQSRNTLRSVFDSISDPLIMIDHDLCIRMANRATIDYFHLADYLEILGEYFTALAEDYFAPDLMNSMQSAVLKFEESSFESNSHEKSGKFEKVFIYPTHKEHRGSGSAIVRISDITKEKILTMELIQREKLASLGLLVSSVTHEINNPNNFISFNIPILRDSLREILPVLDEHAAKTPRFEVQGMPYAEFRTDVMKLLDNIEYGSKRINTTVTRLKEFSRKKDDKGARPILPTDVIQRAIAICQTQIRKTVKTFDVQMQQVMPEIVSDPDAIEQTLINLLINAAQAADKSDSYIRLKVKRGVSEMEDLVLEVEDNGCGMDKKTASRIFDPFFTTKEEGFGTGLGLYISKNLLESVRGSISVESEIGTGTTFRVVIPDLKNPDRREQKGVDT
jgi:signal transduction histidine kinase